MTINQHSLPPSYAYVDNYNEGAHDFLICYEITEPTNLFAKCNDFKLFRFSQKKIEEMAPEYYKDIKSMQAILHTKF